jgi:hypothetical protein
MDQKNDKVIDVMQLATDRLNDVYRCFKPGVKMTLLVRRPGFPDQDFMLTDDSPADIIDMVQRRIAEADKAAQAALDAFELARAAGEGMVGGEKQEFIGTEATEKLLDKVLAANDDELPPVDGRG